jgi:hypothetical protein
MLKKICQASLFIALAFCLPVLASPMDAQYAQTGYDRLVRRGSILLNSQYSRAIREAISLIGQGKSVDEASRRTGVRLPVLQKILRLGTPIPAVDPSTVIQAILPVPELPKGIRIPKKPTNVKAKKIKIKPQKSTKVETVLAYQESTPSYRYVEGWGLGQVQDNRFGKSDKFKFRFRVVEDFSRVKQPEPRTASRAIPDSEPTADEQTNLSPSQRALMDLQRRFPQIKRALETKP